MNLKPIVHCLAFGLLAAFAIRADAAESPPVVVLNGLVTCGDLQCAVLVMDQSMTSLGQGFVLVTGESRHGIRLLAVNAAGRSARIESGGQVQTLRLGAAPEVMANVAAMEAAMAAANEPEGYEYFTSLGRNSRPAVNTALIPGNPGYGTIPPLIPVSRSQTTGDLARGATTTPVAGNSNPANTSAASTPLASGAPTSSSSASAVTEIVSAGVNGGVANTAVLAGSTSGSAVTGSSARADSGQTTATPADWYTESLNIESDRLVTEARVLAGEMTPLPRTPLTPANTPAELVDSFNGIYSNHNSDFLTRNGSHM